MRDDHSLPPPRGEDSVPPPRVNDGEEGVLRAYLKEVRKTPLLTVEAELALARRAQAGDEAALQALVKANLRFVVNVVKRYRRSGIGFLDLINEGNVGLIRAARKFDPEKGLRFISYAVWWIRTTIGLFLARQGGVLAIPAKKMGLVYKMESTHNRLYSQLGREPTHEELARALEVDTREINRVSTAVKGYVALDKFLFAEGALAGALNPIVSTDTYAPVERALSFEAFQEEVSRLLPRLSSREAAGVRAYFGMDSGETKTFAQVGEQLGVSREGARLIFHRAVEKLRRMPEFREIRDYWL
jgi:RNA polymerase primary sigma factor